MEGEVNYLSRNIDNRDPYAVGLGSLNLKKNNLWVKRGLFIFVVLIFIFALYFFITYTFLVEDKEVPEDENALLYVLAQVNPVTLIFGEPEKDIYGAFGGGNLGYGKTCAGTEECSICLECADIENDEPDLGPICLYIASGNSDSIGGCNLPLRCDGIGHCVECFLHNDCATPNIKCNLNDNFGTCVKSCPFPEDCTDRNCGKDGCGFACGSETCPGGQICIDGLCEFQCQSNCEGKQCGSDGCSGTCGECLDNQLCNLAGLCIDIEPAPVNTPSTGSSSSTGSGGNIAPTTSSRTFTPSEIQLKSVSGYQRKDYKEEDVINLKNLNMGNHNVKILEINDVTDIERDYVKIHVASTPQNATLYTGNIKRFDLDDDSYYDIKIQLNSVKSNLSNISINYIHEKIEIPKLIIDNSSNEIPNVVDDEPQDNSDWDLEEEPKESINYLWIIIGIISTAIIAVLMFFLISLLMKIKNVANGKKDITNYPEIKSLVKEHNEKVNSLLLGGYDFLSANDCKNARKKYEEIKKFYNPMYDPDKRIYDKIGEFLKRILKLES